MCSRTLSTLKYSSAAFGRKTMTPGTVCAVGWRTSEAKWSVPGMRPEQHALRQREPPDQHREREDARDEHALQDADAEHRGDRHHRDHELGLAHAAELAQLVDPEHALHRGEHQRRQQRLRQARRRAR